MAYNGSGTFLINTAGQPVVSGTVISSTAFNALTADLATGLSTAITKDGQTTVTANIPMSTYKFTGLGVGSAATDSANLSQVQSTVTKLLNSVSGADTITATASPTLAAYAAGQMFYFVAAGDNTTSVTLNIDSLGAKAVTRDGATALAASDIKSGEVVVVVYDGTRFQVVSQLNSAGDARFANVSIASSLYVGGVSTFVGNAGFSANVSITSALSVGGVAAITGATTIGGNLTLSGGTANGVLYLNGSKVATSGSALVFDGSNLGVGGSPGYRFDVTGGTSSFAPSNSVGAIRAQNNSTTALELHIRPASGKNGFISFTEDTIADRWVMGVLAGNAGLLWGTGNPGSYSEQMRLTSTGLGIGTASPAYPLQVRRAGGAGSLGISIDSVGSTDRTVQYFAIQDNASGVGAGHAFYYRAPSSTTDTLGILLDESGNLGLGVTPSAWGSGWTAFQLSASGAALSGRGSTSEVYLSSNAHFNGSNWIYKLSATAAYYGQDSGVHKWFNAPSGTAGNTISFTQAMTLDASGRLLVGRTTNFAGEALQIDANGVSATVYSALIGNSSTSTSVYNVLRFNQGASGSATGMIGTGGSAVGNNAFANNFVVGTQTSNALVFATNDTERARITSGGDFGIGTTNPLNALTVRKNTTAAISLFENNNASTPNGLYIDFSAASPDNNSQYFLYAEDSTAARCYIYSDGDLANHDGVYGTISDQRLKQDIVDAGSQWDDLKAVRFRKYRMKTDVEANPDSPAMLGVVAQELEAVCPGLVDEHTDTDGETTKTVKSSILLMKAAVALQEAMARIETLEAKVAALESK